MNIVKDALFGLFGQVEPSARVSLNVTGVTSTLVRGPRHGRSAWRRTNG